MSGSSGSIFGIGVVSYNQRDGLLRTLDNLAKVQNELLKQGLNIPIHISDNASNDYPNFESYKERYGGDMTFSRHQNNIGFSGNLLSVLEKIEAKYVLVIGCGEKLDAKLLFRFVTLLKNFDSEGVEFAGGTTNNFEAPENLNFVQKKEAETGQMFTGNDLPIIDPAISLNIWNRNLALAGKSSFRFRNSWPHVELACDIRRTNMTGSYFQFMPSMVSLDQQGDGWHNSKDFLKLLLEFDNLVTENPDLNIGRSIKENSKAIGSWIYTYRRKTHLPLDPKKLFKLILRSKYNFFAISYLLLMSLMPLSLIRFASRGVNLIASRKGS